METIIDHAYVRKPPQNSKSMGFREVLGWQTHPRDWGLTDHNSTGTEAPVIRTCLVYLFIWLFIWRSLVFTTAFSKLVNVGKCLPEFCELLLQFTEFKQEVTGTSDLQPSQTEVVGNLWLATLSRVVISRDWALNLWGLTLSLGR